MLAFEIQLCKYVTIHKKLPPKAEVFDYLPYWWTIRALSSKSASSSARLNVVNATEGQLKAVADIGPEIVERALNFYPCAIGQGAKCLVDIL